jgi:hypothetical protein
MAGQQRDYEWCDMAPTEQRRRREAQATCWRTAPRGQRGIGILDIGQNGGCFF